MSPSWIIVLVIATTNFAISNGQSEPSGLNFNLYVCTNPRNCTPEATTLVADYYYKCSDQISCDQILPASDYARLLGLTTDGNQMKFTYQGAGARVFMLSGQEYRMFDLLNHEITFDVDLSTVGCGLNAALDLTGMPADGGKQDFGYAGAYYGTGACGGFEEYPNCEEMDIWEANSLATMVTVHPCNGTRCNEYGCGFNPYPLGHPEFYGRGSDYTVDTTKPFTVVTRFFTADGTDNGDLKDIQQFYVQDGRTIQLPQVEGGFSSVSDEFCDYHYIPTLPPGYEDYFLGVTAGMTPGMKKGMVLAFSLWGDLDDTFMGWLDQEPYGPCPVYNNPNATVTYSNIRFGPIGSTV